MRVAEISIHSCPLRTPGNQDIGGMNLYIKRLSQELSKLGVEVDIFTRRHDDDEPEIIRIDAKTRLIHIDAGDHEDIPKIDIYNYMDEFSSNLIDFIKHDGIIYDLLHSHYWLSALAAEQLKVGLGIPDVITFHTLGEVENRALENEEEPELRIKEEKRAVATADRIIAFTQEEKDNLVSIYSSQPQKIKIIPGGVDLNLFRPLDKQQAKRELDLLDYSKVLLFAGRIQPIKGLDVLLHTLTYLPNGRSIRLLVVGGSAGKANELVRLNSLVNELGINSRVAFMGPIEHERMPLFYNAADVCVVPSYHESFGLVAMESLATGTPVVASRVGGLTTIVRDGENGYLVDEQSPEAFALHLCLLLSEDELRQSMAKAARPSVMKYDWSLITRSVYKVYLELIKVNC